ncbi:MAG: hypothetical protein IKN71_05035 [Alphaproteobacteria bacterium]|nr:hypothetical protein [Alphaproteobacteria bacterium]
MFRDNEFFKGLDDDNTEQAISKNKLIAEHQKLFSTKLSEILQIKDKAERVQALTEFSKSPMVQSASSNQIMGVYVAFRDNGAFQNMIDLYNSTENQDFKEAPMVREFLAVAYNKTNDPTKAIKTAYKLIAENAASGDVYGSIGKACLLKTKTAKNAEEKHHYTKLSADAYEAGFMKYMEFYPGINAVYRQIDLGNLDKAQKMAQIVYYACEKEGASETKDYWCSTSKLEASCIAGIENKQLEESLQELLAYDVPAWQFETTRDTLKGVNEKMHSPVIERIVNEIDAALNGKAVERKNENSEQAPKQVSVEDSLINNSYSYRGLASNFEGSNTITGNFKFGGQLADHAISRKDIALFTALLDYPMEKLYPKGQCPEHLNPKRKFKDISDVGEFLTSVDSFIRYHYGTENFVKSGLHLEDNAEIQSSIYDNAVDTIIKMSGKEKNKSSDSKTNISALFALGLGDCRHHANVKQIMFDIWQGKQMNDCLKQACKELVDGDPHFDETIKKFHHLKNVELRTFDLRVNMPIEINGLYDAQKNADGKYIPAQKDGCLEEHTLNMLLKRDENGHLNDVVICDAFYQNQYDWKEHHVNPESIKVDDKGKFHLSGGQVRTDKVEGAAELPITLEPTGYAGRKDSMTKADTGNSITLIGIPMKDMETPRKFVEHLQHRTNVEEKLRQLLRYMGKPTKFNAGKSMPTKDNVNEG